MLAVPAWKKKYLQNVKKIAEDSLDWSKLGPVVAGYRKLLDPEIQADTRKLSSFAEFQKTTADAIPAATPPPAGGGRRGPPGAMNLHAFADARRKYLLENADVKKASE